MLPVLLLIVFATVQYGFFFFQWTAVENAVGVTARQASLGTSSCADLEATLRRNLEGTAVDLAPGQPRVARATRTGVVAGDDLDVVVVEVRWQPTRFGLPLPFTGSARDELVEQPSEPGTVPQECGP